MPIPQESRLISSNERLHSGDLHKKMDEFNIRFERPILRKEWPNRYSKAFMMIHDISRLYYEDYIESQDRSIETIRDMQKRVHDLRQEAEKCKNDLANEETWRECVEKPIVARLQAKLICERCRNDPRLSDYQPGLNGGEDGTELEQQKESAQLCECNSNVQAQEDNGEHCLLFDGRRGVAMTHHPDDELERSGIPMRPDRVIGLKMTASLRGDIAVCPPDINHSPFRDRKVLYPFLVIEAKPEKNCPGFASIEAQTAFPIRRCLQLQNELLTACELDSDPLVWFLAYQGDEWRLYAGTSVQESVIVYDLWHGNIRWHDGALQLLQIMDHISEWARDVYYPRIRQSLVKLAEKQTALEALNQPSFTAIRVSDQTHDLTDHDVEMIDDVPRLNDIVLRTLGAQDRCSHPLLKWVKNTDNKTQHCSDAIIRHSNLVSFSFRLLDIPGSHQALLDFFLSLNGHGTNPMDFRALIGLMNSPDFVTWQTRRDIGRLQQFWSGDSGGRPANWIAQDQDEYVGAFFLFRTFCRPDDWQIIREICCITWSTDALAQMKWSAGEHICLEQGRRCEYTTISGALAPFRNMCGKASVWHALQATNAVLWNRSSEASSSLRLKWKIPSSQTVTSTAVVQLLDLMDVVLSIEAGSRVGERLEEPLVLIPFNKPSRTTQIPDFHIPDRFGRLGATVAVRPAWKSSSCPRFCMFVMQATDFEDGVHLSRLIESTISVKDFYGILGESTGINVPWEVQLNKADHEKLQRWQQTLRLSV